MKTSIIFILIGTIFYIVAVWGELVMSPERDFMKQFNKKYLRVVKVENMSIPVRIVSAKQKRLYCPGIFTSSDGLFFKKDTLIVDGNFLTKVQSKMDTLEISAPSIREILTKNAPDVKFNGIIR